MMDVEKQIDDFDAYFRSANGVNPNARISVPTEEWAALREALKTLLSSAQSMQPKHATQACNLAPAPDERAAFEAWLGIKPCGAAHDFGWAAWQARAALAATQAANQGEQANG